MGVGLQALLPAGAACVCACMWACAQHARLLMCRHVRVCTGSMSRAHTHIHTAGGALRRTCLPPGAACGQGQGHRSRAQWGAEHMHRPAGRGGAVHVHGPAAWLAIWRVRGHSVQARPRRPVCMAAPSLSPLPPPPPPLPPPKRRQGQGVLEAALQETCRPVQSEALARRGA